MKITFWIALIGMVALCALAAFSQQAPVTGQPGVAPAATSSFEEAARSMGSGK